MSVISKEENMITIAPGRDIVSSMVENFKQELAGLLAENPPLLRLDMTGVELVDSIGIGAIIAVHNSMNKKAGKLLIIHLSDNILNLFQSLRMDQLLYIE